MVSKKHEQKSESKKEESFVIPHLVPEDQKSSILEPSTIHSQVGATTTNPIHENASMGAATSMEAKIQKKKPSKFVKPVLISLFALLAIVLLVGGVFAFTLGLPGYKLLNQANALRPRVDALQAAVNTQDISVIKAELQRLKTDVASLNTSMSSLSWAESLPLVGAYIVDAKSAVSASLLGMESGELLINTIEPYADLIGLKGGAGASSGAENANNRLEFLVKTASEIGPKFAEVSDKAQEARALLQKIDPNRYPEEFRGIRIREQMTEYLALADEATGMLATSKPLVQMAPYFLGVEKPIRYLVVFQNDNELRPTGGFLSAYSILEVTNGKVKPVVSSDIYILDGKYTPSIAAPEVFRNYLRGIYAANNRFRLRDMNWNPDFKMSMDMFVAESTKAGLSGYDGIVVVDTQALYYLLDVIGNVGVPGFGNFNTTNDPRCECPQFIYALQSYTSEEGAVVWSENEPGKIVSAPKNFGKNRKDILGELMNSVLANTLGQPKEKMSDLAQAAWKSVLGKHVQLYMVDQKAQEAVEAFNLAGRIREFEGDYLHINDANLGGRKSNLYVTSEVTQDYKIVNGKIEKTVSITYTNPRKQDPSTATVILNSVLPNWTRVYVPKGSTLVNTTGFENTEEPYEELGKTVFAGGFLLRPEGTRTVTITYTLPFVPSSNLPLLIQKQGGPAGPFYTINSGRLPVEFELTSDKELTINLSR